MGVNVVDMDGDRQEFPDATTWHVDERGQLHLNGEAGPVASFSREGWQSAGKSEAAASSVDVEAVAREVAKALNARPTYGDVHVHGSAK